jgi:hypothetical protein
MATTDARLNVFTKRCKALTFRTDSYLRSRTCNELPVREALTHDCLSSILIEAAHVSSLGPVSACTCA